MELNDKQLKALERLRKAMKACGDAGIYLYVANGSLTAFDAKAIDKYEKDGRGDAHDAMCEYRDQAVIVPDYNTHIDGGDY